MYYRLQWSQSCLETTLSALNMLTGIFTKLFRPMYILFFLCICCVISTLLFDGSITAHVFKYCLQTFKITSYLGLCFCGLIGMITLGCALMTFVVALFEKPSLAVMLSTVNGLNDHDVPLSKNRFINYLMTLYASKYLETCTKLEALNTFPKRWVHFTDSEKLFVQSFLDDNDRRWFELMDAEKAWCHLRTFNANVNIEPLDLN